MINLLSCDPGSTNFGWAVLSGRRIGDTLSFKIIANGMCPCPIKQVKNSKDLRSQQLIFQKWFAGMLDNYQIDAVCAERFMARGLLGALGEYIGIMLGIMLCTSKHKPLKVFPAATWKNAVKRNTGDKEWLSHAYKMIKVVPHQLDATLMGVWTIYQGFKRTDFKGLDLNTARNTIFTQIENTSQTKLINRKIKR